MDREVLRLLEYDKVRKILARMTRTSPGRSLARDLEPMDDPEILQRKIAETAEMRDAAGTTFHTPLTGVEEVREPVKRAAAGGGPLETGDLLRIARLCDAAETIGNGLKRLGQDAPHLQELGDSMPQCPGLKQHIRDTIDSEGHVVDEASEELAELRQRIQSLRRRIENALESITQGASSQQHLQYSKPSIYRDRYVLAVKSHHKSKIDGIVHGTSDSGATVYLEPMKTFELGNDLSEAQSAEEEEVKRILWEITRHVARQNQSLRRMQDLLAKVDLISAKARMASRYQMCKPEITEGDVLELREARHPILLRLTEHDDAETSEKRRPDFDEVVPIDVHLGDDFQLLVITGPNTGGKTVTLKTVGLLCLMARAGMFVPADTAQVPLYDGIYADIGDEQSLEQSLSTFSSHMSRIMRVLDRADEDSLVLLDELGAGTDPTEGAALGETILNDLVRIGASGMVTTHLGQLKTFTSGCPAAENACVEFDSETLRPTYHLTIGAAGQSNALEIADRLGMPQRLLQNARDILDGASDGAYGDMLDQVRQAKQDSEQRRERAQYLENKAEELKEEYEKRLARIKEEEERTGADIGLKIQDQLEEVESAADDLYDDVRFQRKSLAKRARAIRDELREVLDRTEDLVAGREPEMPLQPGDEVYVAKVHKWGTVDRLDEKRGRATVSAGGMQLKVDIDDLVRWGNEIEGK